MRFYRISVLVPETGRKTPRRRGKEYLNQIINVIITRNNWGGNALRTKHKLFGLLLTLLICLAPWSGVALAEKAPAIVAIDILTTNDFHGALVEAGKNPGAAKFAAFLLQQRAKNPYGSIFVSAGDMFQGSPDSICCMEKRSWKS